MGIGPQVMTPPRPARLLGPVGLGLLGGVFLLSLAVRLVFVFGVPYANGDWILYRNVTLNIFHGCGVAVTLIGEAVCTPHFGGNQLPLYPAFAAAVWWVFGMSDNAIRICQSVLAASANVWLTLAVLRATGNRIAAFAVGGLLSISMVQAYWAATLLTEELAIAATAWVLAELLLSFAQGRLRCLPVGVAMIAATWMRMDGILLLVPVALATWLLEPRARALRSFALVLVVVGTPLCGWALRNIAVGISPFPATAILLDGSEGPLGYGAWVRSWLTTPDQRAQTMWLGMRDYSRISIGPEAYSSATERDEVEGLLTRLRASNGQPFPADIDAAFARLAAQRRAADTPGAFIGRNLARAWELTDKWVWPFAANPGAAARGITPTDLYRFAVVVAYVLSAVLGWALRDRTIRFMTLLMLVYVPLRVAFFALTANVEVRYMVELAPGLEVVAALGAGTVLTLGWQRMRRQAV